MKERDIDSKRENKRDRERERVLMTVSWFSYFLTLSALLGLVEDGSEAGLGRGFGGRGDQVRDSDVLMHVPPPHQSTRVGQGEQ